MGVGLAEYRAVIGRFAVVARHQQLRRRTKTKPAKSNKVKEKHGETTKAPKEELFKSEKLNRSWGSVDRWETGRKRRDSKLRSSTCTPWSTRQDTRRTWPSPRERSQSSAKKRKTMFCLTKSNLKDACNACRTDWVTKECQQRGRARRGNTQKNQRQCCKSSERRSKSVETENLYLFTCLAVSECIWSALTAAAIVQMLLIRAGIEMNPGNHPFGSFL